MNGSKDKKAMRPIWYFVGWMLLVIGLLVIIGGILSLFFVLPNASSSILNSSKVGRTHPDLWWGGFIALVGGFYIWKYHGVRVN